MTWEKRYLNALKKCYRATKPHRAARIKFVQAYEMKWRVILKELIKYHRVYDGGWVVEFSGAWLEVVYGW